MTIRRTVALVRIDGDPAYKIARKEEIEGNLASKNPKTLLEVEYDYDTSFFIDDIRIQLIDKGQYIQDLTALLNANFNLNLTPIGFTNFSIHDTGQILQEIVDDQNYEAKKQLLIEVLNLRARMYEYEVRKISEKKRLSLDDKVTLGNIQSGLAVILEFPDISNTLANKCSLMMERIKDLPEYAKPETDEPELKQLEDNEGYELKQRDDDDELRTAFLLRNDIANKHLPVGLDNLEERLNKIIEILNTGPALAGAKHVDRNFRAAESLIRDIQRDVSSEEWRPHRELAYQCIRRVLIEDKGNRHMLLGMEEILQGQLRPLLSLDIKESFKVLNDHVDLLFDDLKSKVYPHGVDTSIIADKIIQAIKGHPSFETLPDQTQAGVSRFLENEKLKMEKILKKQVSRHAGKEEGSPYHYWNSFCQKLRAFFRPSTTAEYAKGELETLKNRFKQKRP